MTTLDINNFEKKRLKRIINNSHEEKRKNKTFTSKSYYIKKIKNQKYKSQNKLTKNKKLPSLPKLNNMNKYLSKKDNSLYITSYNNLTNINQKDKEGILMEINIINKDIRKINKEYNILKKEYDYIENKNILNKFLMEKILDLYENENDKDHNNETNKKIITLKKQISFYNTIIKDNENKLNEIKNRQKQKKYQELIVFIKEKNKEIKETLKNVNELRFSLFKNDTKIKYYTVQLDEYNNKINDINQKNNIINKNQKENETIIKNDIDKLKSLNDIQVSLDQEIKNNEQKKNNLEETKNKLFNEIEENKNYFEERDKNNKIYTNLLREQNKLEYEINKIIKNKNYMNSLNYKYLENISNYEDERPSLLEKAKLPKKNQDKMKDLENNIKLLKDTIQKNNEEYNNTEKNINMNIQDITAKNNDYKTQIDNYIKEKKDLTEEINQNKKTLEDKSNELEKINKEFININEQYEKRRKEYEEKREKVYIEKIEKYNKEINEMKIVNEKYKKENEELKIIYEEKNKMLKELKEGNNKLNNNMEDIQQIPPPE